MNCVVGVEPTAPSRLFWRDVSVNTKDGETAADLTTVTHWMLSVTQILPSVRQTALDTFSDVSYVMAGV